MNKMEEPHVDDTCMKCGSYNNEWVICEQCLKEVLRELGISEEDITKMVKQITR